MTKQTLHCTTLGLEITLLALMLLAPATMAAKNINSHTAPNDTIVKEQTLPDVTISAFVIGDNAQTSTGAVTIIDAKTLAPMPVTTIPDALNLAPGIVAQSGSAGTQKIMIRGIGSRSAYGTNRIKGFYGQIPLTTADGVTSFDELDLWSVAKADIIKGPSSALYGSGLGGSIVFKPNAQVSQSTGKLAYQYGSFGFSKIGAKAIIASDNQQFGATITKASGDGYRQNSASDHLSGNVVWQRTSNDITTDVLVAASRFSAHIPSSLNANQLRDNPQMAAPNWLAVKGYEENQKILAGATFRYRINNSWMMWATVYANGQNGHEHRPFNVLDDQSAMIGAKFQFDKQFAKNLLTLGAERSGEQYDATFYATNGTEQGNKLSENHQNRSQNNLYAWWKYLPTQKLTLTVGANLNTMAYRLTDSNGTDEEHRFDPVLSPRIGINYAITKGHYLFSSAGHGLSHPSTEETLAPPGAINRELKSEQGNTVEVGARGLFQPLNLTYTIAAYIIWIDDQLVTKREDEATFYGINGGNSQLTGLEVDLLSKVWQSASKQTELQIGASGWIAKNRFTDFVDNGNDYSDNDLPGIPTYTYSAWMTANAFKQWSMTLATNGNGKQWLNDANSATQDAWFKADAKIMYTGRLAKRIAINFEVGAINVFDQQYVSMVVPNAPAFGAALPRYYYPALPRHYYMAVTFVL